MAIYIEVAAAAAAVAAAAVAAVSKPGAARGMPLQRGNAAHPSAALTPLESHRHLFTTKLDIYSREKGLQSIYAKRPRAVRPLDRPPLH